MNFLKFCATVLAVICIASCNEKMITETPEGAGYITVTSQIGSQTKAGYETKTLPAEFIMDINQGNASFNYTKLRMSKDASSNEYTADKEDLKWVSTDHKGALVKAMTIPSGVATIDDDDIVNINLLSDQRTPENFMKNDILGARNSEGGGITIKGDDINVSFQHLMSKLHVVYEIASTSVKVSAITLKNVCLGGAYSYADINYVGSLETRGNINMYVNPDAPDYSIFAAEAIFFPFEGKPTLEVTTNAGTKTCEIVSQNFNFMPGKRYVLKITIDANGNVTKSNISTENDWVKNVPGGKILWIGTSIPYGAGTNNYPQMIANATGLEIINNSVGGSVVLAPDPAMWNSNTADNFNDLYFGGLSQSYADVELFRTRLTTIANNKGDWTTEDRNQWINDKINELKKLSYETLIIPYIDGTLSDCETIIIDHGFNDIYRMIIEAGGLRHMDSDPNTQWGDVYLTALADANNTEVTYENYCAIINSYDQAENSTTGIDDSYIMAMYKVIDAIEAKAQMLNKEIKIIIGNYFAIDSPWVNWYHFNNAFPTYKLTRVLCYYNEAIAGLRGLDIVNVYENVEIPDGTFCGEPSYDEKGNRITVYKSGTFCPDGLHPSSDITGNSNKKIADAYLTELPEIFSSTKTKSSSNSYDYGWEDVEML